MASQIPQKSLDAEYHMLGEANKFEGYLHKIVQCVQEYESCFESFLDDSLKLLDKAPTPRLFSRSPDQFSDCVPSIPSIPEEHSSLLSSTVLASLKSELKPTMHSIVEQRLLAPAVLWIETYKTVREMMPQVQQLLDQERDLRTRVEAAKNTVVETEAAAPLEPTSAAPFPGHLQQDVGPSVLHPARAEEERHKYYQLANEYEDLLIRFDDRHRQVSSLLTWLVHNAEHLRAVMADMFLYITDKMAQRDLPESLLVPFPTSALGVVEQ